MEKTKTDRRPWRRLGAMAACLAVSVAIAACGGDDDGAAEGGDVETIKIGAIHPLTGDLALDGQQSAEAAKLAVKDINEAGGIEALGGAQLELVSADSKGDPETGRSEAQRLVDNGAAAIIGAYQSAVSQNIATVAQRSQVPFVLDITAADAVIPGGESYVFRIQPRASAIGSEAAAHLAEIGEAAGEPIKTIAYMHDNSDFGTTIAKAFAERAEELGMEVVLDIPYDPLNATDFTTEITRVKAAKPDVLAVTGYVPDGELILRNVASVKPGVKLVYGVAQAAFEVPELKKNLGQKISDGVMAAAIRYDEENPRFQEIAERYKQETGEDIRLSAVYSYQAIEVIAEALEQAGSTDGPALREALANLSMEETRLAFPIQLTPGGENEAATPIVVQHQDGKLVQVAPENVRQAEPRVPAPVGGK